MTYTLPDLPYAYDALEPYIDEETMHLHHGTECGRRAYWGNKRSN